MSGGFWAGSIPPWAYAAFACACLLFLCTGELDGMRRGAREAREDEFWAREQAKARRTHPVYRERTRAEEVAAWIAANPPPGLQLPPPEVAHEAWLAHEQQALAIASDQPLSIDWADCCVCGKPTFRPYFNYQDQPFCGPCADGRPLDQPRPDPRTDSQWTADMAADMDAWLAGLLGTHPVTEEL